MVNFVSGSVKLSQLRRTRIIWFAKIKYQILNLTARYIGYLKSWIHFCCSKRCLRIARYWVVFHMTVNVSIGLYINRRTRDNEPITYDMDTAGVS